MFSEALILQNWVQLPTPAFFREKNKTRFAQTSPPEIHEFCNLSILIKNENDEKKLNALSLQIKMTFLSYSLNFTFKPKDIKCSNTQMIFYARSNETFNLIQDFFWTFRFAKSLGVNPKYFIYFLELTATKQNRLFT